MFLFTIQTLISAFSQEGDKTTNACHVMTRTSTLAKFGQTNYEEYCARGFNVRSKKQKSSVMSKSNFLFPKGLWQPYAQGAQ